MIDEFGYPTEIRTIVRKIGQPDSINNYTERNRTYQVYYYDFNKLIFNVHNTFLRSEKFEKPIIKPIKTDKEWINEGYEKKWMQVEDVKCACRPGLNYDTGERCRIHEYNNNECGSLTPYPKGDSRGIGSYFCKKTRAVKGIHSHGHHTWFAPKKYKKIEKWIKK